MQEFILDLLCDEKDQEPYFRHLKRKWFRNYTIVEYEVSIHHEMHAQTATILRLLKQVLTETYDKSVGQALLERDEIVSDEQYDAGTSSFSGISLETDDRYLNGKGKFIIEGIERLNRQEKNLADIRGAPGDERSVNPRSSASNMSGQTGFTVPKLHFDRGRSYQPQVQNLTSTLTDTENQWKLVGNQDDEKALEDYMKGNKETNDKPDDDPEQQEVTQTQEQFIEQNDPNSSGETGEIQI